LQQKVLTREKRDWEEKGGGEGEKNARRGLEEVEGR
jgi:hypothetical protein